MSLIKVMGSLAIADNEGLFYSHRVGGLVSIKDNDLFETLQNPSFGGEKSLSIMIQRYIENELLEIKKGGRIIKENLIPIYSEIESRTNDKEEEILLNPVDIKLDLKIFNMKLGTQISSVQKAYETTEIRVQEFLDHKIRLKYNLKPKKSRTAMYI